MPRNFTTQILFDGRSELAVIIPTLRRNGMHFEVNIPTLPRFWMKWSVLDRYDIVPQDGMKIPDNVVLAVSDAVERFGK